ncbi:MAG: hypothetical protein Q8Q20_00885 [bacterium]|nr:hypothetical protein [bacterium]
MRWKLPPKIKIYEALGCLADGRLIMVKGEQRVYSSSRNKYYTVVFNKEKNAIASNDNTSFWQGYLGYPAIAYLMSIGELPYDVTLSNTLRKIPWKDMNTRNSNDFSKTQQEVDMLVAQRGVDPKELHRFVDTVFEALEEKRLTRLGKKQSPPQGY